MTTPIMQQYQDAKERHPGMLLLFRIGDFYELFYDDAEADRPRARPDAHQPGQGHSHGGVSAPRLEAHLQKLLQAGYRVAICDQVEDAAQAKGLVKREVTRVVTPGTLTEDDLLDPRGANYLATAVPMAQGAVRNGSDLAWLELSTGQFQAADVPLHALADELAPLSPRPSFLLGAAMPSARPRF